jgi:hypothetical protein
VVAALSLSLLQDSKKMAAPKHKKIFLILDDFKLKEMMSSNQKAGQAGAECTELRVYS